MMTSETTPFPEIKRLQTSLKRLPEWAQDVAKRNERHEALLQRITNYTETNGNGKIYQASGSLFNLGMVDLANSLLLVNQEERASSVLTMSQAYQRLLTSKAMDILFLKRSGRNTGVGSLDSLAKDMFGALSTGQIQLTKQFFTVLKDGLEKGYGLNIAPYGYKNWRYGAMVLCLVGDYLNMPVDLDQLKLPRDPAWAPLVQHWNDADVNKVQSVLLDACNIHVSRIGLTSKEYDAAEFDFISPFTAVYPAEILAVLRLREVLNLANPKIDHPLMNTPYAQITRQANASALPEDTLLTSVLNAARQRDPDIMEWWDNA